MAQRILSASGCPEAELSVVIVDDDEIRILNREYLNRDRPTNVISFPLQEGEGTGIQPQLLGDVVISADTAARDALEAGIPFESELYFLLLHGILHLLGYEHSFTHEAVDLVNDIAAGVDPSPSFADGLQVQRVLAALEASANADSGWREV